VSESTVDIRVILPTVVKPCFGKVRGAWEIERATLAVWKPGAARWSRWGRQGYTRPGPMYQICRMIGADPGAATLGSCWLHHERETRWRWAGVTTESGEGWSDGMARICAPGKDSVGSTGE
jgi:hypothetical protein